MKTQLTSPLRWYGGKARYADWLNRWLPPHSRWVDVFGGGGSVTLRKAPASEEIYNDLDAGPVDFFRSVRDDCERLVRFINDTPPTEANYYAYADKWERIVDPVERSARFFLRLRASFSGESSKRFSKGGSYGLKGKYREAKLNQYLTKVSNLPTISRRMESVYISNASFDFVIPQYDDVGTLFYCDPPYTSAMRSTRGQISYRYEMTDADHTRLIGRLRAAKGLAVLSGYDFNYESGERNELYNDLLNDWARINLPTRCHAASWTRSKKPTYREEVLWLSPRTYYALMESSYERN